MGCNCKNKSKVKGLNHVDAEYLKEKYPIIAKPTIFLFKVIAFILSSITVSLIVLPIGIYISFKMAFGSGEINITNKLMEIGKRLKAKDDEHDDDDDDDDDDDYNDDDELVLDYSQIELLNDEK